MKTVSKKLFSLMLAVVLLVSIVPFQAMAATEYKISVGNVPKAVGDAEGWVEGKNYTVYTATFDSQGVASLKDIAGEEPAWAEGVTGWTISTPEYEGQVFSWDMTFTAKDFDENGYVGVYPASAAPAPGCDHNFTMQFNNDKHWEECSECGEKKNEAAHTMDGKNCTECDFVDNTTTGCTECGEEKGHLESCSKYECPRCHMVNVAANGHKETCVDYRCPEKNCGAYINDGEDHKPECPKYVKPAASKKIKLWGLDTAGDKKLLSEITITEGQTVGNGLELPSQGKVWLKEATGVYRSDKASGYKELTAGAMVNDVDDFENDYYAVYNSVNASKDGLSKLTVVAYLYSDGVKQDQKTLFTVILDDGTHILNWLNNNNNRVTDALASASWAAGYERTEGYFYQGSDLAEQTTINNGDKVINVKLNATEDKSARVLLKVHSKVGDTAPELFELKGHIIDGKINRDQIQKVIEKNYKTSSKTKLDGLYSKTTWDQKVGGEKPTGVYELTIDKDYFEVHVILTNANVKNENGTADSSNPKTGDTIFMTVTVMAVSAIALAGAYLLNKKRMAK